jgi:hypothetical protein
VTEAGVGVDVAFVGHHHAGGEGEDVVAVVPLLALGLEAVAAGGEEAQGVDLQGRRDRGEELVLAGHPHAVAVRGQREADQRVAQLRVDREGIAVDHRHHRVEVHAGAARASVSTLTCALPSSPRAARRGCSR